MPAEHLETVQRVTAAQQCDYAALWARPRLCNCFVARADCNYFITEGIMRGGNYLHLMNPAALFTRTKT